MMKNYRKTRKNIRRIISLRKANKKDIKYCEKNC